MSKKAKPIDHLTERKKRGLTQSQYWNPLGVQQATASRYERSGRNIPATVQKLAILAYRNNIVIPEVI